MNAKYGKNTEYDLEVRKAKELSDQTSQLVGYVGVGGEEALYVFIVEEQNSRGSA